MRAVTSVIGIGIVAAGLYFSDAMFTVKIEETEPESRTGTVSLPGPQTSTLIVPLTVPLAVLQEAIDDGVPTQFRGEEPDFTDLLRDDRITWHVDRRHIRLTGGDRLHLEVDATGKANARGVLDLRIARKTISATADVEASLHLSGIPTISEDWTVTPHLAGDVVVHRAEIPVKNVGTVSAKGEVERELEKEKDRLVAQLERKIREDRSLKREAEAAWEKLFVTERVGRSPPVWLRIRPTAALVGQPHITTDSVHFKFGCEFIATLVVSAEEPVNGPTPLPNAEIRTLNAAGGALEAVLVAKLPWEELSTVLFETVGGRAMPMGNGGEIQFTDMTLSPAGSSILLTVDLTARNRFFERAQGRVSLTARPELSDDRSRLLLKDIEYAVQDGAAVRAITWFYESEILEQLESIAEIEISKWLADGRAESQDQVDQIVDHLPEGVSARIDVENISVNGLHPSEAALLVSVGVRASLHSRLTRLAVTP